MTAPREKFIDIITRTGDYLLENMRNTGKISLKKNADYVTEKDLESENFLRNELLKILPGAGFSGEEKGHEGSTAMKWIVDPLDGTTNYIHSFPFFCVSAALEKDGEITQGAVYSPWLRELFYASKGKGAYINGDKISVSGINKMQGGLFATGFPFRDHAKLDRYLASFKNVFLKSDGIRRCGSAALDMCFVACGRFDGFWEDNLSPWDIAAGMLIVREAGGFVTDFVGKENPHETGNVICSNKKIFAEFFDTAAKTYINFREGS